MIELAIHILWLLIGIIVLLGVVWIFLYVLKSIFGLAVPVQVERAVWVIALILILIGALTLLAGGGRLNFG